MTSLRCHHWSWCTVVAVCVWERYLRKRKESVWSPFSQEGEGGETGTDGAEKEIKSVCLLCLLVAEASFLFFSFFWQTLNTKRPYQGYRFKPVSQVCNSKHDSDEVTLTWFLPLVRTMLTCYCYAEIMFTITPNLMVALDRKSLKIITGRRTWLCASNLTAISWLLLRHFT